MLGQLSSSKSAAYKRKLAEFEEREQRLALMEANIAEQDVGGRRPARQQVSARRRYG